MRSQLTTDAGIAAKAHYATYGAAGVSFFGGLTSNDIAAICGAIAALGGLAVHLYFKRRDDRRRQAQHALEQERERLEIQRLKQALGELPGP